MISYARSSDSKRACEDANERFYRAFPGALDVDLMGAWREPTAAPQRDAFTPDPPS